MNKLLICTALVCATPVFAGGYAEPVYEPQVIVDYENPCRVPKMSEDGTKVLYWYRDMRYCGAVSEREDRDPEDPKDSEDPEDPKDPEDPEKCDPETPQDGNPGNNKDVGNAGETPNDKGGWGEGDKGKSRQ